MASYFAVDIGGTQVKWANVDDTYALHERGRIGTDFSSQDELIDAVVALAQPWLKQSCGVALSVPGTVRTNDPTGTVIGGGALDYMDGCALGRRVSQACGLPVAVTNDGKSCALGEYAMGALMGSSVGVVIAIGTGLGGGIVADGHVLSGAHGFAGEFSFVPTDYAPGLDVESMAARGLGWSSLRDIVCKERGLSPSERQATDGHMVFQWINDGDAAARRGLTAYARRFAMLLFSLQAIVDPDVFAIGGGISAQDALIEAIRQQVDEQYGPWPLKQLPKPHVVRALHGNDANLLGATYELRRHLEVVPT